MQISRAKDMKAEQNDAPQHLRTKKKKNPLRFLAIIGIGSTLFWTLTLMFGKPIVIDLDQIKRGIRFADQPVFQHAPQTTNAQPVAQPQALQEVAREESPKPKPSRSQGKHHSTTRTTSHAEL